MHLRMRFVVLAAMLALAPVLVLPQTSATGLLTVAVVDPSGAVVPGANLELTDAATNVVRKAATLENGVYTFPNLPFGEYKLAVSKTGFGNELFTAIQVQTGRTTDVKATLQVASSTATVQVNSGETPLIETSSSVLADTIDTKQVVNLPMQSRNVYTMTFLVPGWASTGANSTAGHVQQPARRRHRERGFRWLARHQQPLPLGRLHIRHRGGAAAHRAGGGDDDLHRAARSGRHRHFGHAHQHCHAPRFERFPRAAL